MVGPLIAGALRIASRFARAGFISRGSLASEVAGLDGVAFEVEEERFTYELLRLDSKDLNRARLRALARLAARFRASARELAPVGATSRLAQGIVEKINARRMEATVISKARHTRPVLHGRRPGRFPPAAPIRRWVARLGVDVSMGIEGPNRAARIERATFLVRRAIARRGTAPQDFVTAPYMEMVATSRATIRQELRRVKAVR